jgi:hypothetical protein
LPREPATAQYKSIFYQTNHSSSIDVGRKDTQDNSVPFTPNQVICDHGSGATGYTLQKWHIFSEIIEIPKRKFEKIQKTVLTLSLILRFNIRLGGYSIWSASTSCTIYVGKDFGALAPHSLDAAKKSTQKTTRCTRWTPSLGNELRKYSGHYMPELWTLEALEELNEHLQKHSTPAGLDYKELGGLLDPGQRDCSQA